MKSLRMAPLVALVGLAAVLVACGGGTGNGSAPDGSGEPSDGAAGPDGASNDIPALPDAGLELPFTPDVAPGDGRGRDAAAGDGGDAPAPGQFGAPCVEAEDCDSHWCVESNAGPICTRTCLEDCPTGFSCRAVLRSYPEVVFVCVPEALRLCTPCQDDAQCSGGVCAELEGGRYCTMDCAESPCPATYTCEAVALGGEGGERALCLPQTGSCDCSADTVGQLRACWVQNDIGTCYGYETCEAETGWGACDAEQPVDETCNGLDDDCDAFIDEDLPASEPCSREVADVGVCVGEARCFGLMGWLCDAPEPRAETCNLLDDDCDGTTDEDFKSGDVYGLDDHCGGCFLACAGRIANGTARCDGAAEGGPRCVVDACDPGFVPAGTTACVRMQGATTCRPCNTDSECLFPGDVCLTLSDGRFCGPDCGPDNLHGTPRGECAEGFICVADTNGEHCQPLSGACTCLPADDGTVRICVRQNAAGVCYGQQTCAGETGWSDCTAAEPDFEICNGLDDNCNGVPDDLPGVGDTCVREVADIGRCSGTMVCSDGPDLVCSAPEPVREKCNARDDDCDGETDEDFPGLYDPCTVGTGACLRTGILVCVEGGSAECAAQPGTPREEACNGIDDDCDGETDPEGSSGCLDYYRDHDNDTFGTADEASHCLCRPDGDIRALVGGDCDDLDFEANPASPEVCDGGDNDCDGETDEGVLSECADCDPWCAIANIGLDGDEPFTPTTTTSSGIGQGESGALVLDTRRINLSFLWVPNAAEDTVSRLDTNTGWEVARYAVCDNPSRTAVDLYGNVYVACRDDDRLAKVMLDRNECHDRNGDGQIATSQDLNGDHRISGAELLPAGSDECVAWLEYPLGADLDAVPQGLAVDGENRPWVGFANQVGSKGYLVQRLSTDAGAPDREVTQLAGGTHGLAVDRSGRLWVVSRTADRLMRLDINDNPVTVHNYSPPGTCVDPYGIVIDRNDKVWLSNSDCPNLYRFDPETEQFTTVNLNTSGLGAGRGMATSSDGWLIVGHHTGSCSAGRAITKVNIETSQVASSINLAPSGTLGPNGVAFDYRGFLWATNQCTNNVSKVDLRTDTVLGTYALGQGPDAYADLTGYNLHVFAAPSGYYRHTVAGWPQFGTRWEALDVTATMPAGTSLQIRARAADTVSTLATTPWSRFVGPFPPSSLPLDLSTLANLQGNYLEAEVWLFTETGGITPEVQRIDVRYTAANPPQ